MLLEIKLEKNKNVEFSIKNVLWHYILVYSGQFNFESVGRETAVLPHLWRNSLCKIDHLQNGRSKKKSWLFMSVLQKSYRCIYLMNYIRTKELPEKKYPCQWAAKLNSLGLSAGLQGSLAPVVSIFSVFSRISTDKSFKIVLIPRKHCKCLLSDMHVGFLHISFMNCFN